MSTWLLFVFIITFKIAFSEFIFPNVSIEVIKPKGLQISVPYNKNVILFAFHANINKPIRHSEVGSIAKEVYLPNGNAWQCKDPDIVLNNGDKLHYWAIVQVGKMRYRHASVYEVTAFSSKKIESVDPRTTSCSDIIVNLTISLLDAKENITSLEETNFILQSLLLNHPKTSTELVLHGPPIADEEVESIVRALIREKLELNIKIDHIKKHEDGKIKFRVLTINDKIAVIKAARKKLKQSSFSFIY